MSSSRECAQCGDAFDALRATARYCGSACRAKATKTRQAAKVRQASRADVVSLPGALSAPVSVESSVRTELGGDESPEAMQAFMLARRLDQGIDVSGTAVAAVSKRLGDLMAVIRDARTAVSEGEDEARVLAYLQSQAEGRLRGLGA